MNTQPGKVLRYLKRHRTITPREALLDLNVPRLAAVVHELRKRGWNITTDLKANPETGGNYASYYLGVKPPARS